MTYNRSLKNMLSAGSALIIVVILTSLLAIIGMMFVMMARVDKMATSAISENKELNFAVETVVALVSQELVLDVPRTNSDGVKLSEYYDYPGQEDKWLASLEPYDAGAGNYRWLRISDIYDRLGADNLEAEIIADYRPSIAEGVSADADGDGVTDSKWVKLDDMTSNKGKPIYAAVRVVDNGGMINVNTVFANPPSGPDERKGDMLTDIYIDGFVKSLLDSITEFLDNRSNAPDARTYYTEAARRIENPDTTTNYYTLYDISEELSLRNRFVLIPGQMDQYMPFLSSMTRLESYGPPSCLYYTLRQTNYGNAFRPYSEWSDWSLALTTWKGRFNPLSTPDYDFRHLLTTCNTDRIITPDCNKMANINTADVNALYSGVRKGLLDTNPPDVNGAAAQIAVNVTDYRDNDSNVTVYLNPDDSKTYYGFESPCIYISELAHRFQPAADPNADPNVYRSYAVELYKPYTTGDGDPDPNSKDPDPWYLGIEGISYTAINWSLGSKHFYVVRFEDPCTPAPLKPLLDVTLPSDPCYEHRADDVVGGFFSTDSNVCLLRPVYNADGAYLYHIVVDSVRVPEPSGDWWAIDGKAHSIQRDITQHKCIRRLWASAAEVSSQTLGTYNNGYFSSDPNVIQAHPYLDPLIYENKGFKNIGEIGMVFRKPAYYEDGLPVPTSGVIGYSTDSDTEKEVRLNLADPCYQSLFEYLTVFDPNSDTVDNDGDGFIDALDINTPEYKVAGRININTAPWYVIAQLPWVSRGTDYSLAQAIVAYRDKLNTPVDYSTRSGEPGFRSIGELNRVADGSNNYSIDYYQLDPGDLTGFPDLTPSDSAPDDFEERDVIFARISNLVTVRSDVFTAYILVRIGADGPQKRVIAILDRSDVRRNPDYNPSVPGSIPYFGKMKIIALHPVPDPR